MSFGYFLFVANVWNLTKRRSEGLKKITNSNSNFDVVITNYNAINFSNYSANTIHSLIYSVNNTSTVSVLY